MTLAIEPFDFVIPLYQLRWNTQAVVEGLTVHYAPRTIHVVTPEGQVEILREKAKAWQAPIQVHPEEPFFVAAHGLTKDMICAELTLGKSLYNPGWFYQQLLKLGAAEGVQGLSKWYVAWDSDLLPVNPWPLMRSPSQRSFALLQHNRYGNRQIVDTWAQWIRSVLGVEPVGDAEGTFIPHHMWFKQEHLSSFQRQLGRYYQSEASWLLLMMRSAREFGTFSEYWAYVSWVAAQAPEDLAFHPYDAYGATTERFFDDGTGLFSAALRQHQTAGPEGFSPAYREVAAFIQAAYGADPLPSSLSFESSPRHLKKDEKTMHIEELRSRWNPRSAQLTG